MSNIIDQVKEAAVAALDNVIAFINDMQAKGNTGADSFEKYLEDIKESIEGQKANLDSEVRSLVAHHDSKDEAL